MQRRDLPAPGGTTRVITRLTDVNVASLPGRRVASHSTRGGLNLTVGEAGGFWYAPVGPSQSSAWSRAKTAQETEALALAAAAMVQQVANDEPETGQEMTCDLHTLQPRSEQHYAELGAYIQQHREVWTSAQGDRAVIRHLTAAGYQPVAGPVIALSSLRVLVESRLKRPRRSSRRCAGSVSR